MHIDSEGQVDACPVDEASRLTGDIDQAEGR